MLVGVGHLCDYLFFVFLIEVVVELLFFGFLEVDDLLLLELLNDSD